MGAKPSQTNFRLGNSFLIRVLLDNNIDRRLLRLLAGHEVEHVQHIGWDSLRNGDLIAHAENAGFDALVTADKNMRYQQSLKGRKISIVTLAPLFVDFRGIEPLIPQLVVALDNLSEGSFITVQ